MSRSEGRGDVGGSCVTEPVMFGITICSDGERVGYEHQP
jgi:hypothetical protein